MSEQFDSAVPKTDNRELQRNESEEEKRFSFNYHGKACKTSILSKKNAEHNRIQKDDKPSFKSHHEGSMVANGSPSHERWRYVTWDEITDNDILLGRGMGQSHVGNFEFRRLVGNFKYEYMLAPKDSKPSVAKKIVGIWRANGGRFLDRISASAATISFDKDIWYDVGDKRAQKKASMSLREKTPDVCMMLRGIKKDWNRGGFMPTNDSPGEDSPPLPRYVPPPLTHPSRHRHHSIATYPIEIPRRVGPHLSPTCLPPPPPGNYPPLCKACSDDSSYRSRSSCSTTTTAPRERDSSPAPAEDACQGYEPRLVFCEADLRDEIKALRIQMEAQNKEIQEQSKHIEELEKKLIRANVDLSRSGEKNQGLSSTEKCEVTPKPNMMLSPVHYKHDGEDNDGNHDISNGWVLTSPLEIPDLEIYNWDIAISDLNESLYPTAITTPPRPRTATTTSEFTEKQVDSPRHLTDPSKTSKGESSATLRGVLSVGMKRSNSGSELAGQKTIHLSSMSYAGDTHKKFKTSMTLTPRNKAPSVTGFLKGAKI